MRIIARWLIILGASCSTVGLIADADVAPRVVETDLVVNQRVNGVPTLTDANGNVHLASFFDANLVNPWGIASSTTSPFWISDNGAGVSTLHNSVGSPLALVVSIPAPGDPLGSSGTPTGAVFNTAAGQGAFTISGVTNAGVATSAPAVFLFSTEDGTIVGWNPGVNPIGFDPAKAGTYGIIAINHSSVPSPQAGAVYRGLAIATNPSSHETLLYVTNFRAGTVETYDTSFTEVDAAHPFEDPRLPAGYAPFNIAALSVSGGLELFVTYAVQDADKHDDVAGQSHGIVNTFDLNGQVAARFAQHGQLNSPWGLAIAPASFGAIAGDVLIGNFGNGHINVFAADGSFVNKLRDPHGQTLVIDGLWGLRVGNGGNGGDATAVYFTAGPNGEQDGLFGRLTMP